MVTRPFTQDDAQLLIELARLTERVEQMARETMIGARIRNMTVGNCIVFRAILVARGYVECAICGACTRGAEGSICYYCTSE